VTRDHTQGGEEQSTQGNMCKGRRGPYTRDGEEYQHNKEVNCLKRAKETINCSRNESEPYPRTPRAAEGHRHLAVT
jgi:hypothetical protein